MARPGEFAPRRESPPAGKKTTPGQAVTAVRRAAVALWKRSVKLDRPLQRQERHETQGKQPCADPSFSPSP